jgi:hypothetical protein
MRPEILLVVLMLSLTACASVTQRQVVQRNELRLH